MRKFWLTEIKWLMKNGDTGWPAWYTEKVELKDYITENSLHKKIIVLQYQQNLQQPCYENK